MISLNSFSNHGDMAAALAADVTARLSRDLETADRALWLVSGGSTPKPLFAAMSGADLDWSRIDIALVDERFVPESHARSNTAFVKATLMQGKAAAARFVPLVSADPQDLDAEAVDANARYSALPAPSSLLLGLGGDGHTASLFPKAGGLETAMDMASGRSVAAIRAIRSDVTGDETERLTVTRAYLADLDHVTLMITGDGKRAVLDQTLDPASDLPMAHVIRALSRPLRVYWAP